MKKFFTLKVQTRFKVPVITTRQNGTLHKYAKAFYLASGDTKVVRRTSKATDEGHQTDYDVRENVNGTLFREVISNSTDCDGRHSSYTNQALKSGEWVSINNSQRDYSAESMNY